MKGARNPFHGKSHSEQSLAKISKASKKFSNEHPEHYIKMGIKRSLVNRELGLNGKPTRPELIMEDAPKNVNVIDHTNAGILQNI